MRSTLLLSRRKAKEIEYVVMMILWECGGMTEGELGKRVHLDSGTLAPLLKRLEKQGLVNRIRPDNNERKLFLTLTEEGEDQNGLFLLPLHLRSRLWRGVCARKAGGGRCRTEAQLRECHPDGG